MPKPNQPNRIEIRVAADSADQQAALAVRRAVFVAEQNVPPELEQDALDASATHVVAVSAGRVVGTARLTRETTPRIGRVAVLPPWRRQGIAAMLVSALEAEALRMGAPEVSLHSQRYIQTLYANLGYRVAGAPFVEAGINHVPMLKRLR